MRFHSLFLTPALCIVLGVSAHAATFSNFEAAKTVIGQPNFTAQNTANSQTTTPRPSDVALSSKGVLAVSQQNGRVLLYNSIPTTNGAAADVVVGQPDFTSTNTGTTASSLGNSNGVAFSPDGNKLIISDFGSCRVLIYNTIPTTNGAPADVVIGQTDFTSNTGGTAADKLVGPTGVMVTPGGKLIVCDYSGNRVLIYNSIPTTSGASANVVIGQANFTTNTDGSAANKLALPVHTALTADGKLIIANEANNSVRIFNSIPTTNGASADVIIGQSAFSLSTPGTSSTALYSPVGVSVSRTGQLAIGDYNNHRVLIYNRVPTTNGAAADVVLGQPDFVSDTPFNGGINARSINTAYSVLFPPDGRLLVAGSFMNRVMSFGNAAPIISSVTIAPSTPSTNDTLTATPVASDVNAGATITYSYVWKKNGVAIPNQTSSTLNLATPGNGDSGDIITVTVTATDGTDASAPVTSAPVTIAANSLPVVESVSPTEASDKVGNKRTFTLTMSDGNGTGDIESMWLLLNTRLNWAEGATLIYQPNPAAPTNGLLYLRRGDDFLPPITIGTGASSSAVLDNGSVRVVATDVRATVTGNAITLTLPATIRDGLVSQNTIFARVQDQEGTTDPASLPGDSGYRRFGTYTVTPQFSGGTNSAPTLGKLNPGASFTTLNSAGIAPAAKNFAFFATDANGTGDLESVWFLAGKQLNWANSATFVYQHRTRRLFLRSDDGNSFLGGGMIGQPGIIENSQVRVDLSKVKLTVVDGKSFGITLPLQAKRGLLGQNKIWLRAQDFQGATAPNSDAMGYVQSGTWNVTQGSSPAKSSQPSNGDS